MVSILKKWKEKKESQVSRAVLDEALRPKTVNPKAVENNVKPLIEAYLFAIYSQDREALPIRKMAKDFYESTIEGISEDIKNCRRTCSKVTVSNMHVSGYDDTQIYAFRSLDITAVFNARGTFNQRAVDDTRKALFKFRNDQRQGWILCEWADKGEVTGK